MGQHATIHGKTVESWNGQDGKWIPIRTDSNGLLATAGSIIQAIPDHATQADLLAAYDNFSGVANNDFVTLTRFSNGQVVTAISADPTTTGESVVILNAPVRQPARMEFEASMIRSRQAFAVVSLYANAASGADVVPSPINITSIYQCSADNGVAYNATAGTICTVVLETALPAPGQAGAVYLSDWINITGLVDTRLNYQNACIKYISADRKTITFGFSDEAALPSLAVPVITPTLGTAKVNFYNNMGGASDGFGIRFTNTTATSAALVSIFGGGDVQISGTLLGDHRVTIGSTAPSYVVGVNGNAEIKATSRFRLEGRPAECVWLDKGVDSITTTWTGRASRTAVKPSVQAELRPRFRLYKPVGMSMPVAKIVSVSKSGSTTWTIVHDGAYTFQTGQYVTIKGVRDQTNFASFSTPATITVTNSTTFTLTGTTGTATSYGGTVCICNGGLDASNVIGQAVSVASIDSTTGWLTLTGNTNWSGLSVGDYIQTHGVRVDLTGADLGIDGAWEVASVSTTSLVVKPIYNVFGTRVSPNVTTLSSTNCGGTVLLRMTLRAHDLILEEFSEEQVMIDGQGTSRIDKAVPVNIVSGAVSTVTANTTETNLIAPTTANTTTAASTNATSTKTSAGTVYELTVTNTSAAAIYLKLFNKASAPTLGTDTPIYTIPVPATAAVNIEFGRTGKRFATGIAWAATGAIGNTDSTAIAAGCLVSISYI